MRPASRLYTESEDAFIVANYSSMSYRELASHLGRNEGSISDRLRKLGMAKWKSRPFTPKEDEAIRAGFGGNSAELAGQLGRPPSVVRTRAIRLGLGKWKRRYKDSNGYKVSRIERGDGSLSRRVPEHRHVMEQHLGRVLADHEVVHHVNCRKRDNGIENLHLCATAIEHLRAHHSINNIIADLLDRSVIRFDRDKGVYALCEIRK